MGRGIFIVGTDTDVGKTFVTAGLVYKLKETGMDTCVFKPVLSGGIMENNQLIPGDVSFVKDVAGLDEEYENMNSYCFKDPVSPHIAAERSNVNIDRQKIINDYNKLSEKYEYVVVEGAGGVVVPIVRNEYYIYDMVKDLDLEVIVVTRAGVGTINHTVLTIEFLRSKNINIKGIIVNGYTGSYYEDDNINIIKDITGEKILGVVNRTQNSESIEEIRNEFDKFNVECIL
ncbi:dethiobiotin synthase [Anaeromicrobium sediminis]|uniref:ATP-dependent dethiobiotin synthetase BioD n=1 Tax=Anaeromicrobium sediminis TaxID=1478221 RepID=A0A267MLU8_9FIRM|nr:dethiobiotin synthase [Anaeromicrobium sediminis]PAB59888.1 dethiobiotin synthase [Anaeromicrobium sediminis]